MPLPPRKQLVFDRVTQTIQNNYGDVSFVPTMVCIFTWTTAHPHQDYLNQNEVVIAFAAFMLLLLLYSNILVDNNSYCMFHCNTLFHVYNTHTKHLPRMYPMSCVK